MMSPFCRSSRLPGEIRSKRKFRQIPGPWLRAEKVEEHESYNDTNCSWRPWNGPQTPGKEARETENQRQIATIQTTALLKSTAIPGRVLDT